MDLSKRINDDIIAFNKERLGHIQFNFAFYNFHLFSEIFISIDEYAI